MIIRSYAIPKPAVCIPEASFESRIGRLFIGETGFLSFDHDHYAWGGLVNPHKSCVNLFINVFTISNFTKEPFMGNVLFNAKLPECPHTAVNVSPENLALCPPPRPMAELKYDSHTEEPPKGGISPFLRIAEPKSTLVAEQNGNQIIPPGGSYLIILKSFIPCSGPQLAKLVIGMVGRKNIISCVLLVSE